jgi:hypothetical protein
MISIRYVNYEIERRETSKLNILKMRLQLNFRNKSYFIISFNDIFKDSDKETIRFHFFFLKTIQTILQFEN